MVLNSNFQTTASYNEGVNKTLRIVIDIMSGVAALVVLINLFRIGQFGPLFITTTGLLAVLCILPTLFLRNDKHLALRGGMMVTGYVVANFVGITGLGLGAAAFVAFPFHMALCAALFDRKTTYMVFAAFTAVVTAMAYAFVQGYFTSPPVPLSTWNQSTANWVIMIITLVVTNVLIIALVDNLSRYWKETDLDAANRTRQFETMVEYAPDAIMIFDVDQNRFVSVNARAEKLFGLSRETLLNGTTLSDLSPQLQPSGDPSAYQARKFLQQAMEGGHPKFEWTHLTGDNTEIPCEVSLARMPPFDQTLIRANVADISKRLEDQRQQELLQTQLAASQRLETIGQLTGGVAHDFNNLLAVTLGNLELLQDEKDDEKRAQHLDACIHATLRGADLTRSMLSYARRAPLQPQVVDLNKLVRDTKNWAGRTLPSHIDVETSLLARLWPVEVDPGLAESALLNLILNARDAMPENGKLTIETANVRIDQTYIDSRNEKLDPGRYVMVAVSDTGDGIEDTTLERIFDPFFTTKPAGSGSGLGLPMVLGFMRQSGGTVQVYSELGVGTTFKLYFPAVTKDITESDPNTAPTSNNAQTGKRILLAEDEAAVLEVLTSMLQTAGYAVTTAASGDRAKELFEADPRFDLLLTDIVMPGHIKGTTLAKELRALDPSLPVIFMSGYAAEATVHGNGLRPEDIRLMKPVRRRDLLDAVAKAMGTQDKATS
ncbi:response regulator [uncultured Pelagimonas sp.]|uniref:response regulator n=1 Tax=uncultured Pelagimonas sp. TaxID=1618102 RepID=UPI00260177E7|nr:response regulator [uncultured Pelagimonas sp.]